jgi:hypothetical protein
MSVANRPKAMFDYWLNFLNPKIASLGWVDAGLD